MMQYFKAVPIHNSSLAKIFVDLLEKTVEP